MTMTTTRYVKKTFASPRGMRQTKGKEKEADTLARTMILRLTIGDEDERRDITNEVFSKKIWRTLYKEIAKELDEDINTTLDKEEAVACLLRWFHDNHPKNNN